MENINAPPVADPAWDTVAQPILNFLIEPRSWPDLLSWARINKVNGNLLRNALAWLEVKNRAGSAVAENGRIYWFQGLSYGDAIRRQVAAQRSLYSDELVVTVADAPLVGP